MHSLYFNLGLHLLLVTSCFGSNARNEKDEKMLIMLEFEPVKSDERIKRASVGEVTREERQSPEVPYEYLNLLQQLSTQQQQQQQQTAASAQQPQQQLIQQLVVNRDGSRQPTAARYVLSQDGRLVEDSSFSSLAQGQQLGFPYYQQPQLQQQFQQQLQQQYQLQQPQQSPLLQTQPQQIPAAPTQPVRPGQRAQVSEYTRQQQRILQEYRDAPLRAQIAGFVNRPPQTPVQPLPTGPNSQSPQVFTPPAGQAQPGQQVVLPPQFQDPQNPNIVYTPVPVDPQAYQQLTQQQLGSQFATNVDPQQIYAQAQAQAQAQRPAAVSQQQQIIYQQPLQQEITQDKIRRPINVLPASSAAQPQLVQQQQLPQQYLIETTKPSAAQPQYVSSDSPQFQYIQQPIPPQPSQVRQQEVAQQSTLLQPVAGRGLFTPVKPSRSSIFVSRSSAPKSVSLTISDEVSSEKVPVVRLPSPPAQRTISKQELDALVTAGYTVTPLQSSEYKSKRQQPPNEEGRNHVIYENHQDGVQYQYSPGSSDLTATIKTKKSVSNSEYLETEKTRE